MTPSEPGLYWAKWPKVLDLDVDDWEPVEVISSAGRLKVSVIGRGELWSIKTFVAWEPRLRHD